MGPYRSSFLVASRFKVIILRTYFMILIDHET